MAAQETHSSFGLLSEDAFKVHANAVLDSHATSAERKQVFAYLGQVLGSDQSKLDADTKFVFARRVLHRKQRRALDDLYARHDFDPEYVPSIFTPQQTSDSALLSLLSNDDTHISLGTRTVTGDLPIAGDRVTLTGTGASGKAVDGTLQHTCICNGQIQISGDDVVLRGVHFICGIAASIVFIGPSRNLTIENCTFSNTSPYRVANGGGSVFIYGGSQHFRGNFTLRNCQIGGGGATSFGSWYLADLTSDNAGGAPVTKLDAVVIDSNKFLDCAGEFAVAGMASQPTDSCKITDNVIALQPIGDHSQHPDFFASFDVVNCLRVICTGNTVTGAARLSGAQEPDLRSFLYTTNGSPHSWIVQFTGNTLSEFNIALAMPCSGSLYAPSVLSEGFAIGSEPGEISGVDLAATLTAPLYTGSYSPLNAAVIASVPLTFADNLPSHS